VLDAELHQHRYQSVVGEHQAAVFVGASGVDAHNAAGELHRDLA
jgi:hypothetical protein